MVSYEATTETVSVSVRPAYLDGKTDPIAGRFVFAYFVRIENHGSDDVQLLRRRWTIADSSGRAETVEGEGVVGKQPVIAPGEAHEYQSYCVIHTFEGSMRGEYLMQRENGARFHAQVPEFHLTARAN
ncbi:MAG: Co2+/Mg2+ efflux protein ApaG [Bacteroidota bacterium]